MVAALCRFGPPHRLVLFEHSPLVVSLSSRPWRERMLERFVVLAYKRADSIVVVSTGVGAELAHLGVPASKIVVIHNPVDIGRIRSERSRSAENPFFENGAQVLVAGGRLVQPKDFDTLLFATRELMNTRDVQLLILGEGDERPNLELRVSELGLEESVDLIGFKSPPWPWMKRSNLLVLSSRFEGWAAFWLRP